MLSTAPPPFKLFRCQSSFHQGLSNNYMRHRAEIAQELSVLQQVPLDSRRQIIRVKEMLLD
ncbi:hypothetical protein DN586_05345 [Enterobacter cloacae]|nr:hypothetical protein DN586_05345 [Enterobacter cloacae]